MTSFNLSHFLSELAASENPNPPVRIDHKTQLNGGDADTKRAKPKRAEFSQSKQIQLPKSEALEPRNQQSRANPGHQSMTAPPENDQNINFIPFPVFTDNLFSRLGINNPDASRAREILSALNTSNTSLQMDAPQPLWTELSHIVEQDPTIHPIIFRQGGILRAIASSQSNDQAIVIASLRILASITAMGPGQPGQLFGGAQRWHAVLDQNGIVAAIDALRIHSEQSPEVTQYALAVLTHMADGNAEGGAKVFLAGGHEQALTALQLHTNSPEVTTEAFRLLSNLTLSGQRFAHRVAKYCLQSENMKICSTAVLACNDEESAASTYFRLLANVCERGKANQINELFLSDKQPLENIEALSQQYPKLKGLKERVVNHIEDAIASGYEVVVNDSNKAEEETAQPNVVTKFISWINDEELNNTDTGPTTEDDWALVSAIEAEKPSLPNRKG